MSSIGTFVARDKLVPELCWRHSGLLAEQFGEVLWVIEAERVRDLADRLFGPEQAAFCALDHEQMNVLARGLARLLDQQIAQVVGRVPELPGRVAYAGNALL